MLKEITDKQDWENFTPLQEGGLFLQSHTHKRLFEDMGQQTWLYEYENGNNPIRSLVTKIDAKRGTFLYLPYGPMMAEPTDTEGLKGFFAALSDLAKEQGAAFIRVSPFWKEDEAHLQLLAELGLQKAPIHMLAETLWHLELPEKSEEELLKETEKKHRNLIRRAEKEGVEIHMTTDQGAIDQFWELYAQTFKRHNFTPYPKKLIQRQLEHFAADDQAMVLEARYQGNLLASALIMYYGNIAAYHHGASTSDPQFRKIPASYLLQWEAIKEAQKRGAQRYSFWGIAPYDLDDEGKRVYHNPKHPFCGITHFKTGFGGQRVDLVPCHDLVISPKYYLTWAIEKTRKWKRGF